MKYLSTFVFFSILLSSCATSYTSPEPGPNTASLRISSTERSFLIRAFADQGCTPYPRGTIIADDIGHGLIDGAPIKTKDILIDADRGIVITIFNQNSYGAITSKCELGAEFLPKPAERYEIQYLPKTCGMKVLREEKGQLIPEVTAKPISNYC